MEIEITYDENLIENWLSDEEKAERERRRDESYKNWIAEIEMRGPEVPLKWLKEHINTAPDSIKNHPGFYYFRGFWDGCKAGEGVGAGVFLQYKKELK